MSALRDGAPQLLHLPTSTGYGLGLMNAPWQSLVATVLLGAGGVLAVSSLPAYTHGRQGRHSRASGRLASAGADRECQERNTASQRSRPPVKETRATPSGPARRQ